MVDVMASKAIDLLILRVQVPLLVSIFSKIEKCVYSVDLLCYESKSVFVYRFAPFYHGGNWNIFESPKFYHYTVVY